VKLNNDEVLNSGKIIIKGDNIEPEFIQKYHQTFNEWWNDILDTKHTYIVAIARKGPRMLEVFEKYRKMSMGMGLNEIDNIISEKAISFMSDDEIKDSTFIVIDDILVYGSTLKTVLEHIKRRNPKSISWRTFTYDIEENKVPGLDDYTGESKLPKTKESNAVFCDELVSSFAFLIKPYDIEHPIFYLKVNNSYKSENELEKILKKISSFVFNATLPRQRLNGIYRFCCIFPDEDFLIYLYDDSREINVEMSKMRLYIDQNSRDISLVPIYLFSASVDTLKDISFNDHLSFLNNILGEVSERLHNNGYNEKDIAIGMMRLHTFLIEYLYGRYLILKNKRLFDESVLFEPTLFINEFDIRILFGKSQSGEIFEVLSSKKDEIDTYMYEIINKRKISKEPQEYPSQTSNSVTNQLLYDEIFQASEYQNIRNTLFENKENTDLIYNLWRIFRLMQERDKLERENEVDVIDRLALGFSFSDINEILRRDFNDQTDKFSVSTGLDYLIDSGAIVPVFAKYNGWIGRIFRFGEKINIYGLALIFRKTLENYIYKFDEKYVTKFQFEKLLTLVGILLRNEYTSVDQFLEYYFDKEGARLKVIEREKYEAPYYLDQFCTNHNIIVIPKRSEKEIKIYLNDKFYDEYTRDMQYPSPKDLMMFSNIGGMIWDISFNSEVGKKYSSKQILLALTTCNDKENFLDALKKDTELIFNNLDGAVDNLRGILQESEVKTIPMKLSDFMDDSFKKGLSRNDKIKEYIENVYELCGIIDDKWDVYEALEEIKESLDKIYSSKNPEKISFEISWNYCKEVICLFEADDRHRKIQMFKEFGEMYNRVIEAFYMCIISSNDGYAFLKIIEKYNSLVKENDTLSYLAFQKVDASIVHNISNREDIVDIITDKYKLLQLSYTFSAPKYSAKRKKGYCEWIKERKCNINKIPGTIDDRVFIGGNYDVMLPLIEICEVVFSAGLIPIFPYDFDIPEDEINECDTILVQNCKFAIFENTIDGGQIKEFQIAKNNDVKILVVYNVRDSSRQEKPSQATSMISTDKYALKELKYYTLIEELNEIINEWITRKILTK